MIPTLDPKNLIPTCDAYLEARTGKYEWRSIRYKSALIAMTQYGMLPNTATVIDVGAGWTELDYCLRNSGWRGRYIPVDGCIDGTDLETWVPPREAEWFVALELLEHLNDPWRLVEEMKKKATKGIIISTPNPHTTDVLAMDPTHKTPIWPTELADSCFKIAEASFYGNEDDSLFAIWRPLTAMGGTEMEDMKFVIHRAKGYVPEANLKTYYLSS